MSNTCQQCTIYIYREVVMTETTRRRILNVKVDRIVKPWEALERGKHGLLIKKSKVKPVSIRIRQSKKGLIYLIERVKACKDS